MFLSLPPCTLDIFTTRERINDAGKYGLGCSANFYFSGPEKAIKLAEK